MSLDLPAEGEQNWDDKLVAALNALDARLTAAEESIVTAPGVTSVNDDPGPSVVFTLDDVADVNAPPIVFDQDTGEITSQPGQGDVLFWDQDTGLYVVGPPEVVASHNHDDRYAPIGWEPPYFTKTFVYDSGSETIPSDLPFGTIIFDVANPAAVVVTQNVSTSLKVPVQVTGLDSSSINQTGATLTWNAVTATTPSGGTAVTQYRIYQNGVAVRTMAASATPLTRFSALTPGTTYDFTVAAINADGEGAQSAVETVTTLAASQVPGAPSNLHTTAVTASQVDLAWDAETPDPFAPTTGYNVYKVGQVAPLNPTPVPTRTFSAVGLTGSTQYGFYVKAVNSVGESAATSTLTVNTSAPPPTTAIRSDQVLDYSGMNAKISYGAGTTYGDNTVSAWENTDAVSGHMIQWGGRIYREKIAFASGGPRNRQRRAVPTMAAQGIRWHVSICDPSDARTMTEAQVRTWAHDTVRDGLAEMAGYYLTNAPIAGDLSSIIHSIGGPNEVDDTARTGANWARNAYIVQHELWNQARLGTVVPSYATLFANIPIVCCSLRSNLLTNPSLGTQLGANITGEGLIRDWCDYKNPHKYQGGVGATQSEIQESYDAWEPIVPGKPAMFTEAGYNTMNYDNDSNYIGGGVNHTGAPKVPPWVLGVYLPRAIASFAKFGAHYIVHELLDDADPPTTFNIQSHFGHIGMQGDTTAASPPSGWLPKPSYYAVRRLSNLLRDRVDPKVAPTFTPSDLPATFSVPTGNGVNFQKLVTQKANGHWFVLIWRDVDVFNNSETSAGSEITVSSINVSITLPQARTINVYKPNDATSGSPHGTTGSTAAVIGAESGTVTAGGTFVVPLAGNLKVLEIY